MSFFFRGWEGSSTIILIHLLLLLVINSVLAFIQPSITKIIIIIIKIRNFYDHQVGLQAKVLELGIIWCIANPSVVCYGPALVLLTSPPVDDEAGFQAKSIQHCYYAALTLHESTCMSPNAKWFELENLKPSHLCN